MVNGFVDAGLCAVFGCVAKVEVSEGVPALVRKSALHFSVYVVDRRCFVNGLRECDITICGDGISRNLTAELHLVLRQVYDCYIRQ